MTTHSLIAGTSDASFQISKGGPTIRQGGGSPEGAVTGSPGDIYLDTTGSTWTKATGVATNTGWVQLTPVALTQPTWYQSFVGGSDTADGLTALTAVKTLSEIVRRMGYGKIDGSITPIVTVNILTDDPTNYDIAWPVINGAVILLLGVRTILASFTLAAVTPWAGATQTIGRYTLSGAPDLTALGYAETMFVAESGASNQMAPIGKDLGAGEFRAAWCNINTGTDFEPAATDAVDVFDVPTLSGFCVFEANSLNGYIQFQDLRFSGGFQCSGPGLTQTFACSITNLYVVPGTNNYNSFGCQFHGSTEIAGGTILIATTIYDSLSCYASCILNPQSNTYVQGASFRTYSSNFGPGNVTISDGGDFAIADAAGVSLDIGAGSTVSIGAGSYLFVVNDALQTTGIQIRSGGQLLYEVGFLPVVAAVLPTNEWLIGGTAATQAAVALSVNVVNPANQAMVAVLQ